MIIAITVNVTANEVFLTVVVVGKQYKSGLFGNLADMSTMQQAKICRCSAKTAAHVAPGYSVVKQYHPCRQHR